MKIFIILSVLLVLLSGCVKAPQVVKEDLNKIIDCKDTRDGELFSFNTNSIENISTPLLGDISYTVTTLKGVKKHLSDSMVAYIKCNDRAPT